MVINASEDSIIFSNQKIFENYSKAVILDSYSKTYFSCSAKSLVKNWNREMWGHKVKALFRKVMGWYDKLLDIIKAKIEPKLKKHIFN